MRNALLAVTLVALLGLAPAAATAQNEEVQGLVSDYLAARERALLQRAPTGSVDGGVWSDLFARLLSELDIGGLDQSDGKITFQYKFPGLEESPLGVRTVAVLTQPVLYEPLKKRLGESLSAETASALEEEFEDLDDLAIELQLTWTPVDNSQHQNRRLASLLVTGSSQASLLGAVAPGVDFSKRGTAEFLASVEPLIRAQVNVSKKQPQAELSVTRRSRAGLVGPDETRAAFRFSSSPAWQKAKEKQARLMVAAARADVAGVEEELRELNQDRTFKNLRWLVEAAFTDVEEFTAQRPEQSIDEVFAGESKFTLSAGVGSEVCCAENQESLGRWDFELSHEDTENGGTRSERTVASLMLSKGMPDSLEASFGLVWANKPEFLPDVDEEITARFGVRYKFPGGKPESKARAASARLAELSPAQNGG